ncbi:hypothetical protein FQN54_001943 [Arachnomyces sp. PD_36]|nr:hypothetical protein FQN54_001943 [Arachnomyces sp. PD_36]
MGRRKIEIKAIKDDRNRSVTFLKRKGGLFKKAHELSVLCSVDVAVIIFGHNKKLYEYSSGDINETLGRYQFQYGQPHEHKGPGDFSGKRGEMDDDDDEDISPPPEEIVPQSHSMVPPHMQNQSSFQHINHAPSASPPMHGLPNGLPYHRHGTPQPAQGASRPSSRNNVRRSSSTLVPQQNQHQPQTHAHATPPPQQNGYTYMQNHSMYNGQANSNMPQHQPPPAQPHYQQYGPQGQPQQQQPPAQHHQPSQPPQQHPTHQVSHVQQQAYLQQDQRRQSVPPALSQHERAIPPPEPSPPQQQQFQQPPAKQEDRQSPPPPKPLNVKSRSIFTPIDDRGSVLAQHFGFGPPTSDAPRNSSFKEHPDDTDGKVPPPPPPAPVRSLTHPQRAQSTSSVPDIAPPSRSNSAQLNVKRPRLTVQIPSENSDGGSATADSSPRDSAANKATTPAKGNADSGPSGVVLPPPSPSASALMSAGAQGPPNPFARPPPPVSGPHNSNNIDTPVSALPSRFMADGLLPSPSAFYPDWGFGRSGPDSNLLPSPLTFPTPTMQTGPGFSKEGEDSEKKRKSPEAGSSTVEGVGPGKRLKT